MMSRFKDPACFRRYRAGCRSARPASWVVLLVFAAAAVSAAPTATADSTDSLLSDALMAARGVSCGPLRSNPIVRQAAAEINESTDKWIDHVARAAPVSNSTPLLNDLGYGGNKSTFMLGAGRTAGDSIKALIVQGYRKIPDCSYLDYGVSSLHNDSKDLILTAVVLAA
jgi:hypothetical protein